MPKDLGNRSLVGCLCIPRHSVLFGFGQPSLGFSVRDKSHSAPKQHLEMCSCLTCYRWGKDLVKNIQLMNSKAEPLTCFVLSWVFPTAPHFSCVAQTPGCGSNLVWLSARVEHQPGSLASCPGKTRYISCYIFFTINISDFRLYLLTF